MKVVDEKVEGKCEEEEKKVVPVKLDRRRKKHASDLNMAIVWNRSGKKKTDFSERN